MHLAFRGAHFELKGGRGQDIVSYLNGTLTSLRLAVGEPPATTSLGGAWLILGIKPHASRSASNSPLSMLQDRKTALTIRWRAPPLRGRGRCGRASSDFVVSGGRSGRI